jgi:hypothetical protein
MLVIWTTHLNHGQANHCRYTCIALAQYRIANHAIDDTDCLKLVVKHRLFDCLERTTGPDMMYAGYEQKGPKRGCIVRDKASSRECQSVMKHLRAYAHYLQASIRILSHNGTCQEAKVGSCEEMDLAHVPGLASMPDCTNHGGEASSIQTA